MQPWKLSNHFGLSSIPKKWTKSNRNIVSFYIIMYIWSVSLLVPSDIWVIFSDSTDSSIYAFKQSYAKQIEELQEVIGTMSNRYS